jgi:hypothetical protein
MKHAVALPLQDHKFICPLFQKLCELSLKIYIQEKQKEEEKTHEQERKRQLV